MEGGGVPHLAVVGCAISQAFQGKKIGTEDAKNEMLAFAG